MFALPLFSFSHHARTGAPLWFSEFVATFGLILIIRGCSRFEPHWLPVAVACYIAAGIGVYGVDIILRTPLSQSRAR